MSARGCRFLTPVALLVLTMSFSEPAWAGYLDDGLNTPKREAAAVALLGEEETPDPRYRDSLKLIYIEAALSLIELLPPSSTAVPSTHPYQSGDLIGDLVLFPLDLTSGILGSLFGSPKR